MIKTKIDFRNKILHLSFRNHPFFGYLYVGSAICQSNNQNLSSTVRPNIRTRVFFRKSKHHVVAVIAVIAVACVRAWHDHAVGIWWTRASGGARLGATSGVGDGQQPGRCRAPATQSRHGTGVGGGALSHLGQHQQPPCKAADERVMSAWRGFVQPPSADC